MLRRLTIGALGALCVLFSTPAFAQGTAADAKAMLEKTAAAIKANKAKTLDQINKEENGFLVGDIYPFCFNLSDCKIVAVQQDAQGSNRQSVRPFAQLATNASFAADVDAEKAAFMADSQVPCALSGEISEPAWKMKPTQSCRRMPCFCQQGV